jgi:hypothetical protein
LSESHAEKAKPMTASKTWLESIQQFDAETQEGLLREAARTSFPRDLPRELAFLSDGFVDLGFEHLGLADAECRRLLRAFSGTGIAVPGTRYRLRNFAGIRSVVETADANETATLPEFWKQGVLVLDRNGQPSWVGKRFSRDLLVTWDLTNYRDVGEGLVPPL